MNKKLHLCRPNRKLICELNSVALDTVRLTEKLNDIDELTFEVDKLISLPEYGLYVQGNGYDDLHDSMEIYLEDIGFFQIQEPSVEYSSEKEKKVIVAYATSKELVNKNLTGFKINCGSVDSMEMLIDGNVNSLGFPNEYITLYNESNSKLSLLDIVLENAPGWTVGYVSESLKSIKLSFDIDNTNIFAFLTNMVSKDARCIFKFDTINKKVNVYKESEIGVDTGVLISLDNLANSINVSCSEDSIYTRFSVTGSDGIDIRTVNYGDDKIEDLSYYLNTRYLNSELIEKYNNYLSFKEENRELYIEKMQDYEELQEKLSDFRNRVPNDGCLNEWGSMPKEELDKNLKYYNALLASLQISVDPSPSYSGDTGSLDDYIPITNSEGETNHEWYMEQLSEQGSGVYTYEEIYKYIIPNITIALSNIDLAPDEQEKYVDGWRTEWDYYGLIELQGLLNDYNNQLESLSDYSKPWNELTEEEKNNRGNNEALYNQYHNEYVKINEIIGDRYTNGSLKHALYMRQNQISGITSMIGVIQEDINSLVSQSELRVGNFDMTEEDIEILNILYKDTGCSNENILITSLDNTPEKRNIIRKELLSYAKEQLNISSQPQYSFSVNTDNIYDIPEFQIWGSSVKTGNFIRLNTYGTHVEKMRIVEITYNPCVDTNDLELSFSNVITCYSKRDDFSYLFGDAVSSGNSTHSYGGGSKDSVELSTDVLNLIANSRVFQGKFDNLRLQSIVSSEGVFNQIIADKAFITSAEIEKLLAEKAYITKLEADDLYANKGEFGSISATVGKIDTLMFGAASGNVIQTNFSNSVIAQLGEAQIQSAMIAGLDAGKINAGTIYTNKVHVLGDEDGRLSIIDNTIAISDGTRTRVQIGKDAIGDYNMYVWDNQGNIMFDALGLTEKGVNRPVIRDDVVQDDANISAFKLNINSLFTVINDDNTPSLKSTKVVLDEKGQTLYAGFTEMKSNLSGVNSSLTAMGTELEAVQGSITSKIWQQDIDALSVGGRNYVYNSAFLNGSTGWALDPGVSIDTTTLFNTHNTVKIEQSGFTADEFGGCQTSRLPIRHGSTFDKGETLTVSFWYYLDSLEGFDSANLNSAISGYKDGATSASTAYQLRLPKADLVVGEWTKVSYTTTLSDTYSKCFLNTYINRNGCIWLADFKLEKGNKATDWTPAPEDIDNKISTLTTQYSTLEQTINGIDMEVASYKTITDAKISDVQEDFNNLEIGGRNLILNSDFSGVTETNIWSGDGNVITAYSTTLGVTDLSITRVVRNVSDCLCDTTDKKLILSIDYMVEEAIVYGKAPWVGAQITIHNGNTILKSVNWFGVKTFPVNITDDWIRHTVELSVDGIENITHAYLVFYFMDATGKVKFRHPKLEIGNKATAWSPAPEDTTAEINNAVDAIDVGGTQILRGTNTTTTLGAASGGTMWETGSWRAASTTTGDGIYRESIVVTDAPNSNIKLGWKLYGGVGTLDIAQDNVPIVSGNTYTLSCYARGSGILRLQYGKSPYVAKPYAVSSDTVWNRYSMTFVANETDGAVQSGRTNIYFGRASVDGDSIEICGMKLEKGNKATDWSPAPEDTDAKITTVESNVSKLKIQVDSIESTVSETCVTKDQLGNYATISQMNSAITQKADSITSTVAQTYTTKDDFNNLDIGGRNYIINSAFINGREGWTSFDVASSIDTTRTFNGHPSMKVELTGQTTSVYDGAVTYNLPQQNGLNVYTGEQWTISGWYYIEDISTVDLGIGLSFRGRNSSNVLTTIGELRMNPADIKVGSWTKMSATITVNADYTGCLFQAWVRQNGIAWFTDFKLEKGNKATAWSPAPEDTTAEINNAVDAIDVGGTQILRNTQTTVLGDISKNALWSEGAWRKASGTNGTWESIDITDCPEPSIKKGWKITSIGESTTTAQIITISQNLIPLVVGEVYTVSCYARGTGTLTISMTSSGQNYAIDSTEWKKFTFTFTAQENTSNGVYIGVRYQGDVLEICGMKLEKGNKATDWSPAPEDTDAKIASVETIATQTADKFNWIVKSGTSITDFTLTDRMATLTANIINLNGNVKVNGSMIVDSAITANHLNVSSLSAISANLGTVTAGVIQSNDYVSNTSGMKINLTNSPSGIDMWDSKYFKIARDGKITASGGTIGGFVISDTSFYKDAESMDNGRNGNKGIYIGNSGIGSYSVNYGTEIGNGNISFYAYGCKLASLTPLSSEGYTDPKNITISLSAIGKVGETPYGKISLGYQTTNGGFVECIQVACSDRAALEQSGYNLQFPVIAKFTKGLDAEDISVANLNATDLNATKIIVGDTTASGIKFTNADMFVYYNGTEIGSMGVQSSTEGGTAYWRIAFAKKIVCAGGVLIGGHSHLKNNISLRSYQTDGTIQNLIILNSSNVTQIGSTVAVGDVNICTGTGQKFNFHIGGAEYLKTPVSIDMNGIHVRTASGIRGVDSDGTVRSVMIYNSTSSLVTIGSQGASNAAVNVTISTPTLSIQTGTAFTSNRAMTVSSDIRVKTNINVLSDKYTKILDILDAKTFQYTYDTDYKLNCGFIAQDVLSSLSECDLTTSEFGGFADVYGDGSHYALDYIQFIPILWQEVKKLRQQVKELKGENS